MVTNARDKQQAADEGAPAAPIYQSIGAYIRDPADWGDLPQVDVSKLDGSQIVVHDAMFLRGDFDRPDPDYAIILFAAPHTAPPSAYPRDQWAAAGFKTAASGGGVFVRKLKELTDHDGDGRRNRLPVVMRLVIRSQRNPRPGEQGYVDLVDK